MFSQAPITECYHGEQSPELQRSCEKIRRWPAWPGSARCRRPAPAWRLTAPKWSRRCARTSIDVYPEATGARLHLDASAAPVRPDRLPARQLDAARVHLAVPVPLSRAWWSCTTHACTTRARRRCCAANGATTTGRSSPPTSPMSRPTPPNSASSASTTTFITTGRCAALVVEASRATAVHAPILAEELREPSTRRAIVETIRLSQGEVIPEKPQPRGRARASAPDTASRTTSSCSGCSAG